MASASGLVLVYSGAGGVGVFIGLVGVVLVPFAPVPLVLVLSVPAPFVLVAFVAGGGGVRTAAVGAGAVGAGAVRAGAVRAGAVRTGAVRAGGVRWCCRCWCRLCWRRSWLVFVLAAFVAHVGAGGVCGWRWCWLVFVLAAFVAGFRAGGVRGWRWCWQRSWLVFVLAAFVAGVGAGGVCGWLALVLAGVRACGVRACFRAGGVRGWCSCWRRAWVAGAAVVLVFPLLRTAPALCWCGRPTFVVLCPGGAVVLAALSCCCRRVGLVSVVGLAFIVLAFMLVLSWQRFVVEAFVVVVIRCGRVHCGGGSSWLRFVVVAICRGRVVVVVVRRAGGSSCWCRRPLHLPRRCGSYHH